MFGLFNSNGHIAPAPAPRLSLIVASSFRPVNYGRKTYGRSKASDVTRAQESFAQSLKKRRKEIEKIMGEHDCDFATARQIRKRDCRRDSHRDRAQAKTK